MHEAPTSEFTNTPTTLASLTFVERCRSWLPALAIVICLPILAVTTTKYIILPTWHDAVHPPASHGLTPPPADIDFYATLPMNAPGQATGASGIRCLALVSDQAAIKKWVSHSQAKLTEVATTDLSGLTASDLENPNTLHKTQALLRKDLNETLGSPLVKEVYIALLPPRG